MVKSNLFKVWVSARPALQAWGDGGDGDVNFASCSTTETSLYSLQKETSS